MTLVAYWMTIAPKRVVIQQNPLQLYLNEVNTEHVPSSAGECQKIALTLHSNKNTFLTRGRLSNQGVVGIAVTTMSLFIHHLQPFCNSTQKRITSSAVVSCIPIKLFILLCIDYVMLSCC